MVKKKVITVAKVNIEDKYHVLPTDIRMPRCFNVSIGIHEDTKMSNISNRTEPVHGI